MAPPDDAVVGTVPAARAGVARSAPQRRRDRSWRGSHRTAKVRRVLAPLVLAMLVLAGWAFASTSLMAPDKRFLLPSPLAVLRVGLLDAANRAELLGGLWSTAQVALVGLLVSIVLGVAVAIVMSQARWLEDSIYPYAILLQTIPVLAIVPLIGFWFGFDFRSRVLVCVLVAVFPIITNTLFGLKSADQSLHDLFTLHRASRLVRLWKLQLPAALPAMFEGFRISAGLGVLGAIIADFFFRQGNPGIGRLIDVYRQQLDTEQLIAAVLLSALLGLLFFSAFGWLSTRVVGRGRPSSEIMRR